MALFRKKIATSNHGSEAAASSKTARVLMFDVSSGWASFWYDVSSAILFFGAFAVAAGTWGTIKLGAIKEKFADERIAANEAETVRAKADGEQAKAVAAQANERAAEANKIAEGEKLARLKLEANLAWRTLGANRTAFVEVMKKFSGSALDVVVYPTGTSDIGPLQNEIVLALRDAGWTVRRWNMMGTEYMVGIGVAVAPNESDETRRIALSLVMALRNADIVAGITDDLPDSSFPMPAVGPPPEGKIAPLRMLVGTKPQ